MITTPVIRIRREAAERKIHAYQDVLVVTASRKVGAAYASRYHYVALNDLRWAPSYLTPLRAAVRRAVAEVDAVLPAPLPWPPAVTYRPVHVHIARHPVTRDWSPVPVGSGERSWNGGEIRLTRLFTIEGRSGTYQAFRSVVVGPEVLETMHNTRQCVHYLRDLLDQAIQREISK